MRVVDDADVTIGNNELSTITSTSVPKNSPADEPTEGTTIQDASQQVPGIGSSIHNMASLIAIAGGLVAMSLLVTSFYHMKRLRMERRMASYILMKSPLMVN